jgi:hypothetical protein
MGIFGSNEDERYSDAAIIRAARKRLLEQIAAKAEAASPSFVNNVYGGGGAPHMGGGVMDRMGSSASLSPEDDPYDYMVNILREDLPDVNPATGKPKGWSKTVTRSRVRKDEPSPSGKKKRK